MFNIGHFGLTPGAMGGSAAAFSPASVFTGQGGGYYDASVLSSLWQDSARTTQVTADGDPVGCWDDLSGNGLHLTQSDNAKRPIYKTSGGLHWIDKGGTSTRWLDIPGNRSAWTAGTLVVAYRSDALAQTGAPTSLIGNMASTDSFAYDNVVYCGFGATTRPTFGGFGTSTLGVITAVAASGELKVYVDKVQNGSTASVTVGFTVNSPQNSSVFNKSLGTDSRVYAMVFSQNTLSSGDLASCETWCGNKQGRSI